MALIAVLISFHQWQISRDAHRREIATKYFQNFKLVSEAISTTRAYGTVTDEAFQQLILADDEAQIYLAPEIADFTKKLRDKARQIRLQQELIEGYQVGPELENAANKKFELLSWIDNQTPNDIYRPYIADQFSTKLHPFRFLKEWFCFFAK